MRDEGIGYRRYPEGIDAVKEMNVQKTKTSGYRASIPSVDEMGVCGNKAEGLASKE